MLYYMHDITWPEFQAKKDSVVILPDNKKTFLRSLHRYTAADAAHAARLHRLAE